MIVVTSRLDTSGKVVFSDNICAEITHVLVMESEIDRFSHDSLSLSFPVSILEIECASIFGNSALGLVFGTVGEIRLNLDADLYFRIWVSRESSDNFFGDLHQPEFGS